MFSYKKWREVLIYSNIYFWVENSCDFEQTYILLVEIKLYVSRHSSFLVIYLDAQIFQLY